MKYGSVCSGIEAASVAWHPLGWRAAFLSEIESFPRAVLTHHYPDVPLHGDFTTIEAGQYDAIDLLVGGTPCQSFSVAGLRGGLADDRGNLALEYLRLADRLRPKWLVWENVPGVLSSNGGRDFGAILGGMVELGYGIAYRVLDAQFFGVPQRRRRVFVVGYLGDWRRAAAVLFERHSLQGHPSPRRQTGSVVAALTADGVGTCGADDNQGQAGHRIAPSLTTRTGTGTGTGNGGMDECIVTHSLRADGFDASEDGTGRGTPLIGFDCKASGRNGFGIGDTSPTLRSMGRADSHQSAGGHVAVAFAIQERAVSENIENGPQGKGFQADTAFTMEARNKAQAVAFTAETMYGVSHADASQTDPDKALRALRDAVGAEAYSKWSLGVLAAFRSPEILQSAVHGDRFRRSPHDRNGVGNDTSSQPKTGSAGAVFALWSAGCEGRAPRGWQPSERLAQELVAHLSELPHQRASAARFLLGLWRASEGLGLLREALSALQEAWRPKRREDQSARLTSAVRRLTPMECERLMGFPDDYTLVTHRNKLAADGPRYKALGNSMAVPCMRWIGERIHSVELLTSLREAA